MTRVAMLPSSQTTHHGAIALLQAVGGSGPSSKGDFVCVGRAGLWITHFQLNDPGICRRSCWEIRLDAQAPLPICDGDGSLSGLGRAPSCLVDDNDRDVVSAIGKAGNRNVRSDRVFLARRRTACRRVADGD